MQHVSSWFYAEGAQQRLSSEYSLGQPPGYVLFLFYVSSLTCIFTVPVFDATQYFQGYTAFIKWNQLDLSKLEEMCPEWEGEVPEDAIVIVLHTAHSYGNSEAPRMSFGLIGVVVLAVPATHTHPDEFYTIDYDAPSGDEGSGRSADEGEVEEDDDDEPEAADEDDDGEDIEYSEVEEDEGTYHCSASHEIPSHSSLDR